MLFRLLTAGWSGRFKSLYPPKRQDGLRRQPRGRHTGIAVERADIPPDLWPANHDYPDARATEFAP
jgi:hypothetical protein